MLKWERDGMGKQHLQVGCQLGLTASSAVHFLRSWFI